MLLDAFRSLWKIDGQQPVVPSHPEVLSSRPGIIVACKVGGGQGSGVGTQNLSDLDEPAIFRKVHVRSKKSELVLSVLSFPWRRKTS